MGVTATAIPGARSANRWVQLVLGVVAMMAISSPQYVWALFTEPMVTAFGVKLSQLQVTFSIVIVLQTCLSPVQGYLIDRFGPRLLLRANASEASSETV